MPRSATRVPQSDAKPEAADPLPRLVSVFADDTGYEIVVREHHWAARQHDRLDIEAGDKRWDAVLLACAALRATVLIIHGGCSG